MRRRSSVAEPETGPNPRGPYADVFALVTGYSRGRRNGGDPLVDSPPWSNKGWSVGPAYRGHVHVPGFVDPKPVLSSPYGKCPSSSFAADELARLGDQYQLLGARNGKSSPIAFRPPGAASGRVDLTPPPPRPPSPTAALTCVSGVRPRLD